MPSDKISAEEISSAISLTQANVQNMARALDHVSSQYKEIVSLMDKSRDYTKNERDFLEEYKRSIVAVADKYRSLNKEQTRGMSDYSVAVKAAEEEVKKLTDKCDLLKRKQEEIASVRRSASNDVNKYSSQESGINELEEKNKTLRSLKSQKMNDEKRKSLQTIFNTEEKNGTLLNGLATKNIIANEKILKVKRAEFELNKPLLAQAKSKQDAANNEYTFINKSRSETEKAIEAGKNNLKNLEGTGDLAKNRMSRERGGFGRTNMGLQIASDMHIPGVSQAATVARYAQMAMPTGAAAEGMSAAGKVGSLAGGALLGAGVLAGGAVLKHGYDVYDYANQMAPHRRQLEGSLGSSGLNKFSPASAQMSKLGYGAMENYGFMQQFSRQVGGKEALGQFGGISKLARGYGADRGELGGMAEGLTLSGGTSKGKSATDLRDIMNEGIRGGMDRARITQFTQQVVGIQKDLLQTTGDNNAQNIAKELSSLMGGSKRGEAFFGGPEMGAIKSLDSAMKRVSSGEGGAGSSMMLRALGYAPGGVGGEREGLSGMKPQEKYFTAMKDMEKGLFGGDSQTGDGTVDRLKKIMGQATSEAGGDKSVAAMRMKQNYGVSYNQFEKLDKLLGDIKPGEGPNAEQTKVLEEIKKASEDTKDPIASITKQIAASEAILHNDAIANSTTIVGIHDVLLAMQEAQSQGVNALGKLVEYFMPTEKTTDQIKQDEDNKKASNDMASFSSPSGFGGGMGGDAASSAGVAASRWISELFGGKKEEGPKSSGVLAPNDKSGGGTSMMSAEQFSTIISVLTQSKDHMSDVANGLKYNLNGNTGVNTTGH